MGKLLNTSDAAEALGLSVRRVVELIAEEKLSATKVGRDYVIEERALSAVKVYGKAGRPPKDPRAAKAKPGGSPKASRATKAKAGSRRPDRRAR
jgi:excisionase family DNA binding protein